MGDIVSSGFAAAFSFRMWITLVVLLCRSAWAYTDSCGYTATYWDDATSDFTVDASQVVAYDGSCPSGFSHFYCEEGAGASCGGGSSTDGFDCANRVRPSAPSSLSPERLGLCRPRTDCQNNWACPCNLVHSAACCYCWCCIASAAGATVEPTGVATPAPTTATPPPTAATAYFLVAAADGDCADEGFAFVWTSAECARAAALLGVMASDADGAVAGDANNGDARPGGCTLRTPHGSSEGHVELWGVDYDAPCGHDGYACLCKQSYPGQTLAPTATAAPAPAPTPRWSSAAADACWECGRVVAVDNSFWNTDNAHGVFHRDYVPMYEADLERMGLRAIEYDDGRPVYARAAGAGGAPYYVGRARCVSDPEQPGACHYEHAHFDTTLRVSDEAVAAGCPDAEIDYLYVMDDDGSNLAVALQWGYCEDAQLPSDELCVQVPSDGGGTCAPTPAPVPQVSVSSAGSGGGGGGIHLTWRALLIVIGALLFFVFALGGICYACGRRDKARGRNGAQQAEAHAIELLHVPSREVYAPPVLPTATRVDASEKTRTSALQLGEGFAA